MRVPAGLTSTGVTTTAKTEESENGDEKTVLMRPPSAATTIGVFVAVGFLTGFIAVLGVVLLARPESITLLSGFGPVSAWAMPATAVASALGLTFLISAVIADHRAEDDLRRSHRDTEGTRNPMGL
ncbi:hypothetical protein [Nocardiopsis lambiniae]|uniref:Cox cluster protein n=1 Tax=Nocardiopsis lambiniae TaxID=3075539 RepID=A0ABU2MAT8_9ACTN|nr:hypothetical protein [Nocardiopsis sp. DSM 44743]MDT0329792.1 hypothetical protein [Nocardiopsis sp. DSM 44743]